MDLRIEQWLNHFHAFLPLHRLVITNCAASPRSVQALRLVPLLKSALVVLLGHWNSVKGELDHENMDVPPDMRNRNQLALSCELMQILRLTGCLPAPLARTAELLSLTTPTDIHSILFSCCFFLAHLPVQLLLHRQPRLPRCLSSSIFCPYARHCIVTSPRSVHRIHCSCGSVVS